MNFEWNPLPLINSRTTLSQDIFFLAKLVISSHHDLISHTDGRLTMGSSKLLYKIMYLYKIPQGSPGTRSLTRTLNGLQEMRKLTVGYPESHLLWKLSLSRQINMTSTWRWIRNDQGTIPWLYKKMKAPTEDQADLHCTSHYLVASTCNRPHLYSPRDPL
jgi:hypothetical protein